MSNNLLTGDVTINGQYVKDLSFENPSAPHSFNLQEKPEINIALDVNAVQLGDKVFEVFLSTQVQSKTQEHIVFIADLKYAGVFTIECEDKDELEKILLVYCPNILFPYARRVLSDVIRDGGYQPLMLEPVDFLSLYAQKQQDGKKEKTSSNKNKKKA